MSGCDVRSAGLLETFYSFPDGPSHATSFPSRLSVCFSRLLSSLPFHLTDPFNDRFQYVTLSTHLLYNMCFLVAAQRGPGMLMLALTAFSSGIGSVVLITPHMVFYS